MIRNYRIRDRRDIDEYSDCFIKLVRKKLYVKDSEKYEPLNIERICSEVTIANKKGSSLIHLFPMQSFSNH